MLSGADVVYPFEQQNPAHAGFAQGIAIEAR